MWPNSHSRAITGMFVLGIADRCINITICVIDECQPPGHHLIHRLVFLPDESAIGDYPGHDRKQRGKPEHLRPMHLLRCHVGLFSVLILPDSMPSALAQ